MRITNGMLINNMSYNLNESLNRLQMLQYQTSTGKKFRVPSDDPIGASKSLKLRTDLSKSQQYRRNVEDANSWMRETENSLKEINEILHRANQLTIQAANETNEDDDLLKIKAEITELKNSLIKIGNSTYGERYIFTGYATDKKLIDEDGKYNIDLEQVPIYDEEGEEIGIKDQIIEYNTGVSERVEVNTIGNKIFGKADEDGNLVDYKSDIKKGEKPYLIALFEKIEKGLGSETEDSDVEILQEAIEDIQKARGNISSVTAEIGAKVNRLELTEEKLKDQELNFKELLSDVEDVSLPEAYMNMMLEMNIYNASLSVGAQIIQPSLADFIR